MSDPTLLQEQRKILQRFRHATQQRDQQERDAKTQYDKELAITDHNLKKLQEDIEVSRTKRLNEFDSFAEEKNSIEEDFVDEQEHAKSLLRRVTMARISVEVELQALNMPLSSAQFEPVNQVATNLESYHKKLLNSVEIAENELKNVENSIDKLFEDRQKAKREEQKFAVGVISLLGFAGVFFLMQAGQVFFGLLAIVISWVFLNMSNNRFQTQVRTIIEERASTYLDKASAIAELIKPYYEPLLNRFDIEFVLIPKARQYYNDSFFISSTPITNVQYRPFIEAGGYAMSNVWSSEGWAWRRSKKITMPQYWDNTSFNSPDQPVVGVSWYEADAYARWLSQETGLEISLPSGKQWLRAAVGNDTRTYPWGEQAPTPRFANYKNNVKKTTPVGAYPIDISPFGVMDMAGNVSEWTSDTSTSSKTQHVLKGGSWAGNKDWLALKTLLTGKDGDTTRSPCFGFRIVTEVQDEF